MNALVRALVIWMLGLAVPFQVTTAATMALCSSGKHTAVAATAASPISHSVHSGVAHEVQHHAEASTSPLTGINGPRTAPDTHDAGTHKCSACASCCSVAGLPNTVLTVPTPAVPPTVFATLAPAVAAFTADGLERPPRLVQA